MQSFEYLMAIALLTGPPDGVDSGAAPDHLVALRPQIQHVAVLWEILDPREVRHVLTRPEDFQADLNMLRRRYIELADAPRLCDCDRFPDRATVNDLLTFNRSYRQHIDMRQQLELPRWWELRAILQETDQLYNVWDRVRDARCDYYYVTVRRQALKWLRDTLGEPTYYSGKLPPSVPLWRFHTIE